MDQYASTIEELSKLIKSLPAGCVINNLNISFGGVINGSKSESVSGEQGVNRIKSIKSVDCIDSRAADRIINTKNTIRWILNNPANNEKTVDYYNKYKLTKYPFDVQDFTRIMEKLDYVQTKSKTFYVWKYVKNGSIKSAMKCTNWIKNNPPIGKEFTAAYYERYNLAAKNIICIQSFEKQVLKQGYRKETSGTHKYWIVVNAVKDVAKDVVRDKGKDKARDKGKDKVIASQPPQSSQPQSSASLVTNLTAGLTIDLPKGLPKCDDQPGAYLYFITEYPFNNKVKIGISRNPIKRLKQLQSGNPSRLIIYHTSQLSNYMALERAMDEICAGMHNEWITMDEPKLISITNDY